MKTKLLLYCTLLVFLTFCNNSKIESLNSLNLNVNPKSIDENVYRAIDKNGTISKGDFFRPIMNIALLEETFLDEVNKTYNLNISCAVINIELKENKVKKIIAINQNYEDLYELKYENSILKEIKKTENNKSKDTQLYPKSISLIKYNYDNSNNLTEIAEYDKNGDNTRKIVYEYVKGSKNIASKMVFEKQIIKETTIYNYENGFVTENYKDDTFNFSNKIQLNKNQQAIKTEENPSDENDGTITSFYYDQNQNIIKKEWFNKYTKVKSIYEFKYKYDDKNNWVQKISFTNKKPEFIIERSIKY